MTLKFKIEKKVHLGFWFDSTWKICLKFNFETFLGKNSWNCLLETYVEN